jgi:hypothetical protein
MSDTAQIDALIESLRLDKEIVALKESMLTLYQQVTELQKQLDSNQVR